MYTITCDGFILDDPREEKLTVESPKVNLEVNTVGSCTFKIHKNHPNYDRLKKLKSVFEVSDEIGVIFRGRMTEDSADFYNSKSVDIEGAMAYFNDSIVRPYAFPEDFLQDADYKTAAESGNVIAFFLGWLIEQHNAQVEEFQQFKLGNVTVSDPNNYLTREDSSYPTTWEVLKSKLFDSALGGYLCIRYEADGNYIDYLSEFTLTNTQEIVFGENLLDLKSSVDGTATYSAIVPIGATIETETTDEETGESVTSKTIVTIENLEDGDITDDIVKQGDTLISKSALEAYGFICAPVKETTWEDVTEAQNLLTKGVNALASDLAFLSSTVDFTAVDMHFTDEQVQSFRIYRNVKARSSPHGHSGTFMLPKLGLDLHNPQNTKITVGSTQRTLIDVNSQKEADTTQRIESAEKDIEANKTQTTAVKNQMVIQSTELLNTCSEIIAGALETYVEADDLNKFKSEWETELKVWAEGISGRVTNTEESIQNVDGDLQSKFATITKYFTFDIGGLTIGQVDNPNKVVIDNDEICILVNGVEVQRFDADGKALIPELDVTTSMKLLGYKTEQDDDFRVNCSWVGVKIRIIVQPQSQTTGVGELAVFELEARGVELSYQWQEKDPTDDTWHDIESTCDEDDGWTLTISSETTTAFRCVITDGDGNTVISDTATLTIEGV